MPVAQTKLTHRPRHVPSIFVGTAPSSMSTWANAPNHIATSGPQHPSHMATTSSAPYECSTVQPFGNGCSAMPTYFARGITATLAVCDLQASLSTAVDLRMGGFFAQDTKRIQDLFDQATRLPEQASRRSSDLAQDTTNSGVIDFVGPREDLPIFVVRAGEHLGRARLPVDGTPGQIMHSSTEPEVDTNYPKALFLQLELNASAFGAASATESRRGRKPPPGRDLKVEIFVNGSLAEVTYVNARKHSSYQVSCQLRFAGTRVHRQCEQPLIYHPSSASTIPAANASTRYGLVSSALAKEADGRGRDKFGQMAPSSELLSALSTMPEPDQTAVGQSLGLIDIVITIGHGQKYGPDTLYNMTPTRLHDPRHATRSPGSDLPNESLLSHRDVGLMSQGSLTAASLPATKQSPVARRALSCLQTSQQTPEASINTSNGHDHQSDTPHNELTLTPQSSTKPQASENTARGHLSTSTEVDVSTRKGTAKRSIAQAFLGEQTLQPMKRGKRTVKKKSSGVSSEPTVEPNSFSFTPPAVQSHAGGLHSQDQDVPQAGPSSDCDRGLEFERILDPTRLAQQMGVAQNGRLMRRIQMIDPQSPRTEMTEVKVSKGNPVMDDAPSPPHHAVALAPPTTPQRRTTPRSQDLSPFSTVAVNKREQARADRRLELSPLKASSSVAATKHAVPNTADTFELPEACKGSSVSFAEDAAMKRQISKSRGGEFTEEELVAGMRFIVT